MQTSCTTYFNTDILFFQMLQLIIQVELHAIRVNNKCSYMENIVMCFCPVVKLIFMILILSTDQGPVTQFVERSPTVEATGPGASSEQPAALYLTSGMLMICVTISGNVSVDK